MYLQFDCCSLHFSGKNNLWLNPAPFYACTYPVKCDWRNPHNFVTWSHLKLMTKKPFFFLILTGIISHLLTPQIQYTSPLPTLTFLLILLRNKKNQKRTFLSFHPLIYQPTYTCIHILCLPFYSSGYTVSFLISGLIPFLNRVSSQGPGK